MTDQHKAAWFDWVRNEGYCPYPRRGFLDHWSCGSEKGHQDDLADAFRFEPITDVTLFPAGSDLPRLARWPEFGFDTPPPHLGVFHEEN